MRGCSTIGRWPDSQNDHHCAAGAFPETFRNLPDTLRLQPPSMQGQPVNSVAVALTRAATSTRAEPESVICGVPAYMSPEHSALPHIVKFSGGRSSAAMVLSLARSGALDPERGDLILFANTTAEHPATYDFAAQVCDELESRHAIPCLWYEFCTVEESTKSGWSRRPSYRLVRRRRITPVDNPTTPGYSDNGCAFEELASLKRLLPNRSLRFCTQNLKILPGIRLISEWLGGGPGPAAAGHHHGQPLTSADAAASRYNGSRWEACEVAEIAAFVHSRPWMRPVQDWADFTVVSRGRSSKARPSADLAGLTGPPVQYVTLLGLRSDEAERVNRAHFEAMLADGANGGRCRHESHPAGEIIATPLADAGADMDRVDNFWRCQSYDLAIDRALGNCVYCFMKGEPALRRLASAEQDNPDAATAGPAGIHWWADIEARYAGPSDDPDVQQFKFLTLRSPSYAEIAAGTAVAGRRDGVSLPCACSD